MRVGLRRYGRAGVEGRGECRGGGSNWGEKNKGEGGKKRGVRGGDGGRDRKIGKVGGGRARQDWRLERVERAGRNLPIGIGPDCAHGLLSRRKGNEWVSHGQPKQSSQIPQTKCQSFKTGKKRVLVRRREKHPHPLRGAGR